MFHWVSKLKSRQKLWNSSIQKKKENRIWSKFPRWCVIHTWLNRTNNATIVWHISRVQAIPFVSIYFDNNPLDIAHQFVYFVVRCRKWERFTFSALPYTCFVLYFDNPKYIGKSISINRTVCTNKCRHNSQYLHFINENQRILSGFGDRKYWYFSSSSENLYYIYIFIGIQIKWYKIS